MADYHAAIAETQTGYQKMETTIFKGGVTMKKTVSILSVLLTLALLAFVLTACFDPKTAITTTGGKAKRRAEGSGCSKSTCS